MRSVYSLTSAAHLHSIIFLAKNPLSGRACYDARPSDARALGNCIIGRADGPACVCAGLLECRGLFGLFIVQLIAPYELTLLW